MLQIIGEGAALISIKKKHLVVTGANGFIGKRIVNRALDIGWKVSAIVRNDDSLTEPAEETSLQYYNWDLLSGTDRLDSIFRDKVDLVCHAAAFIPPDMGCSDYAEKCFKVNALATLRLLEYCHVKAVKRFIYISSGNIYKPTCTISDENDQVYPSSRGVYYLTSKLAGELFAENIRLRGFSSITILRISSVYGPGMKKSGLGKILYELMEGKTIILYDNGQFKADFVYVDNVVEAVFLAEGKKADGLFNIGAGCLITIHDFMRTAATLSGQSPDLIKIEKTNPERDRMLERGFNCLDINKAKRSLGYEPIPLEVGFKKLIEEYKNG